MKILKFNKKWRKIERLQKDLLEHKKNLEIMTAIQKNVSLINSRNNTSNRKIKTKPIDVKQDTHIDFSVESNVKILNIRLEIM